MPGLFLRFRVVCVLPAVLILAGCSASGLVLDTPDPGRIPLSAIGSTNFGDGGDPLTDEGDSPDQRRAPGVSPAALALRAEIDNWMGTPYLWGGNDHAGIDCSAFVQNVFKNALDVPLPRTTAEQRSTGTSVDRDGLVFADLVFFHTPQKTRHVGIYLGDGAFAHASSSRGVMISNLSQSYWDDAYTYSRRPVTPAFFQADIASKEPATAQNTPPAEVPIQTPTRQRPRSRRVGW